MGSNDQPAFPEPIAHEWRGKDFQFHPGMTLRQWYAGQAMKGILSSPPCDDSEQPAAWVYVGGKAPHGWNDGHYPELIAKMAHQMADAMLAEEQPAPNIDTAKLAEEIDSETWMLPRASFRAGIEAVIRKHQEARHV